MMDFSRPEEVDNMVWSCDRERRGYSTVNMTINDPDSPQYVTFHGDLSTQLPPEAGEYVKSGYSFFRTRNQAPSRGPIGFSLDEHWNLNYYEQLALRVRGDYRRYYVNMKSIDTPKTQDVWQHRLFLHTPGEWETVLIPLRNFTLVGNHEIKSSEPLESKRIKTIGIGLLDRRDGPYKLDIAWAKAVIAGPLYNTVIEGRNSSELLGPRSESSGLGIEQPSSTEENAEKIESKVRIQS
ncbi:hypothetical protein BABINDRAFT_159738 [Babjeviella inositovora NRRL Y-12698]|uniref:NADH:ubiquinone oxidoreductase intermediate-associated protein 30 domain-containing protein n=1 Tax=Babjeviella inositovora NRRL Y-12698 TaxID=984486 RepID=A0A1E3QUV4_9ASCO|nr:uncharacterized protein BABINDRAFT_159738 [Babjeviella inositovora NRRL Y-12698]ODQ81449.1 hypothetical protein BABINDRAFT_159738 [Babjeviella inositovora NRRL Y-12698]